MKRQSNTLSSTAMLKESGITFKSSNGGAHLIVKSGKELIDYWPSSGLWIVRGCAKRHRGLKQLIQHCKRLEH